MPLFRLTVDSLTEVPVTSFAVQGIRERDDLQRLLRANIRVLGDDLLVVAEEYSLFQDVRRRIDLLAVDRRGQLVVVELKRTDDGGHMELQALRYAAMVSTMSYAELVSAFAHYNSLEEGEARSQLDEWMDEAEAPEQLADTVRLILVSADFSNEITGTVLWLSQQYGLDISCWRLRPYRVEDHLLVELAQIIPLPEAADFQVQQRRKGATAAAARVSGQGRDFSKYDLVVASDRFERLSKQGAVKQAVSSLAAAGIEVQALRNAARPQRWLPVAKEEGEDLESAFRRTYPGRSPGGRWYDLELKDDEGWWIMPRIGGRRVEQYLTAFQAVCAGRVPFEWSRRDDEDAPLDVPAQP